MCSTYRKEERSIGIYTIDRYFDNQQRLCLYDVYLTCSTMQHPAQNHVCIIQSPTQIMFITRIKIFQQRDALLYLATPLSLWVLNRGQLGHTWIHVVNCICWSMKIVPKLEHSWKYFLYITINRCESFLLKKTTLFHQNWSSKFLEYITLYMYSIWEF